METIIFGVVGFILFIIGYLFGVVNRNCNDVVQLPKPDFHCNCGCGGNWCYKTHSTLDCYKSNLPYPTEWRTASEAIAYQKGMEFGYKQGEDFGYKNGMYRMRETSKEEFIRKFNDAQKPLAELKKE